MRCLTSSFFLLLPPSSSFFSFFSLFLSSSSPLLQWFGILNFLTLFVMLGIGADDIFVLLDVWKQSAQRYDTRRVPESLKFFAIICHGLRPDTTFTLNFTFTPYRYDAGDLESRMEWALHRAFRSMAVTSFTSSAAFFAGALSVIPPLRLFGILTGFAILVDFFLTMTFLAAAVVRWSDAHEPDVCCSRKGRSWDCRSFCCNCFNECGCRGPWNPAAEVRPRHINATTYWSRRTATATSSSGVALTDVSADGRSALPRAISGTMAVVPRTANADTDAGGNHGGEGKAEDHIEGKGSEGRSKGGAGGEGRPIKMQKGSGAVDDASVVIKELKPTSFRCLERFLLEKYAPFLFNHAAKVVVLSFLFVAIALVFATKLPTATKNPSLFPAWHNQKKNDYIQNNLVTPISPTPFPIDIVWGLEEVDGANTNDPESENKIQAVFDPGFNASSVAAQNHFVWLCSGLLGEMDILRSMKSCWILGFQNYCKLKGIDFPVATPALFRETISQYYHDEKPTDILVTTAAQVRAILI